MFFLQAVRLKRTAGFMYACSSERRKTKITEEPETRPPVPFPSITVTGLRYVITCSRLPPHPRSFVGVAKDPVGSEDVGELLARVPVPVKRERHHR